MENDVEDDDAFSSEKMKVLCEDPMNWEEYALYENELEIHQQFTDEDILATLRDCESQSDENADNVNETCEKPREKTMDEKINALQISVEISNQILLDHLREIKKLRGLLYTLCEEKNEPS